MTTLNVQTWLRSQSQLLSKKLAPRGQYGLITEQVLTDLKNKFGVGAKQHKAYKKLYSLKYNQIDVDKLGTKSHPIVRECRGLILDSTLNTWKVVAHPFDRFYNYGEPCSDSIDWNTATTLEKVDGSLMIFYHYDNKWNVATSGTPDASGTVNNGIITFNDLFWNTFGEIVDWEFTERCLARLPKNMTFMLELCTPDNRVVVRHMQPKLFLIGARNLDTGKEHRPGEFIHLFPGIELPKPFPVASIQEALHKAYEMDGQVQEGFVVCDDMFRRIKIKAPNYVALHHLASNVLSIRRVLQDIVFRGETDEVIAIFPEHTKMLQEAHNRFYEFIAELEEDLKQGIPIANKAKLEGKDDKKAFALAVKNSRCSSALFAVRSGKAESIRDFVVNNWHIDNLLKTLGYK